MEAYEAKARIWNVRWNGHEIRFEFIPKDTPYTPRTFLFFDGKCVATSRDNSIEAQIQTDNGKSYLIKCGAGFQCNCIIQCPSKPTLLGWIGDWLYKLILLNKYFAWFSVDEEFIYFSHIGGADKIERVVIQQEWSQLLNEERALSKGEIMTIDMSGHHGKMVASKEEIEQTKIRLDNERKELETRLSSWEAKREKKIKMEQK